MSEYTATIRWQRSQDENFVDNRYSRAHEWQFDGGAIVAASASPHIVPLPYSVAANVDPEEAFVASLSSCHMLFALSIAAKRRWVVDSYIDKAVGFLEKNSEGKLVMSKVILRPTITFGGTAPSREQIAKLHHQAHEQCFIANSVRTDVLVEWR